MAKIKHWKFEDGELKETWGGISTVSASTKAEAMKKLAELGSRIIETPPTVKVKNGAYQLAYPTLDGNMHVEAGTEKRGRSLCQTTLLKGVDVTESTASFDYYASEEYQNNS